MQEAFAIALERWPRDGVPDNPGAWITTTARNRAIDRLRREQHRRDEDRATQRDCRTSERSRRRHARDPRRPAPPDLHVLSPGARRSTPAWRSPCAPSAACRRARSRARSSARSRRSPSGSSARSARSATRRSRTACRRRELLEERFGGVLAVLYLIFNEGYAATERRADPRRAVRGGDLADPRRRPAARRASPRRSVCSALMLLQHSRRAPARRRGGRPRAARGPGPRPVGPGHDRRGPRDARPGDGARRDPAPYQLQAAIAALHARAPRPEDTDWPQIATPLHGARRHEPVARRLAEPRGGGRDGRRARRPVSRSSTSSPAELDGYHLFHAARADLLRRLGPGRRRPTTAYRRALELATNPAERRFLERRLGDCAPGGRV